MDRRLLLAITLSFLVLFSWSTLVTKTQPIGNKEVTLNNARVIPIDQAVTSPADIAEEIPASSLLHVAQPKYDIVFAEPWGAIKEIVFNDYQGYRFLLQDGFFIKDANLVFTKERSNNEEMVFVGADKDKKFIKRFRFSNTSYYMELDLEVHNISHNSINVVLPVVLGELRFQGNQNEVRSQDIAVATSDKVLRLNGNKDKVVQDTKFLGLRNRYFCAIIESKDNAHFTTNIRRIDAQKSEISFTLDAIPVGPGQQVVKTFRIYLGPQDLQLINAVKPDWAIILHYGTFNVISHLLLQLLQFLYRIVNNWGLAIIILSFGIYFVLFPLTLKQMRSMKEMQELQPHIEELRRAHKNNPEKLNKEIMELYRTHKVNPFGGCLPVLLQIPVFFALYQALMRSIVLKGARFLWIKDLSEPDRLFILPTALPILGNEINILPIIMALEMFVQQKISMSSSKVSTAGGNSYAEQQKIMLIIFPVMFGFIFYRMPSGLVMYWFINSTLMLFYQFRISRQK